MHLFDTFELLEDEKKLRLTYTVDSKTTKILIVEIEKFFKELINEPNLLSQLTINESGYLH